MKYKFLLIIFSSLFYTCSSDDDSKDQEINTLSDSIIQEILDAHNSYRNDVNIPDIVWSEEVAKSAQLWADDLATNCEFKHSGGEYGENIWVGSTKVFTPTDVVTSWGSEISDYDYESNTCTTDKDCGHYTQIVWKNSTTVGCGTATCDGVDIWVCQYDPPGNFIGQKPY